MTAYHGYIITRDYYKHTVRRHVGPKDTVLHADNLIAQGVPFRLLDERRNVCYSGMYLGRDELRGSPLDDFGEPIANCAVIQYPDYATGEWVDL